MGCGGSRVQSHVFADNDLIKEIEVQFIWPDAKDQNVTLQVRGDSPQDKLLPWRDVPYKGPGKTLVKLEPGGYNSRWIKPDNKKYLTPTEESPSLVKEILKNPEVRKKMDDPKIKPKIDKVLKEKKISLDELEVEALPTDTPDMKNLASVLRLVEALLPVNSFKVQGSVKKLPGTYANHTIKYTLREQGEAKVRAEWEKKTPKEKIEFKRNIKEKGVATVKKQMESRGYSLDELLGDSAKLLGLEIPPTQLDAKIKEMEADPKAPLSEAEMKALKTGTPEFSSTVIARYCLGSPSIIIPVRFEWLEPDIVTQEEGKETTKPVDVTLRWWKWEEGKKATPADVTEVKMTKRVPRPKKAKKKFVIPGGLPGAEKLAAKQRELDEKFGEKKRELEEKMKKEEEERLKHEAETIFGVDCVVEWPLGKYAYQYVKDGQVFYQAGKAVPALEEGAGENDVYGSYTVVEVSSIEFKYI